MDKTLRVALIGAGENSRKHHIPKLQKIKGVEVAALANRTVESGRKTADQFSIPRVYGHWKEIIDDGEIDAVVIGTWPYLHGPVTLAALERGKHVLCEARMAADSRTAREMYRCSLAHPELIAQVVPSPLTLGVDKTVKRLIGEGYLGSLRVVEVRGTNTDFPDPREPLHWRQSREFSGNNIRNLGILYEAVLRWVGPAVKVNARGRVFNPMGPDRGFGDMTDIPDHVDVIADMACGAQLHMQISGVTGIGGGTEIFLFGSQGTLRFSDGRLFGAQRGDRELSPLDIPPQEKDGWRVEEEFVNAIRGNERVKLTDFATGVKYMEFTDAVNMAMGSGSEVSLPFVNS